MSGQGSSCKRGCRGYRDCGEVLGEVQLYVEAKAVVTRSVKPLRTVPRSPAEP